MGNSMHRLKEMLCSELDEITNSGPMSRDKLELIDKLTHSIKSLATIMAMEEGGYSNNSYGGSNASNGSSRGSYENYSGKWFDGRSYGNSGDNSYRRYSRDEFKSNIVERLHSMMSEASSERDREAIKRCIDQIGG